VGMSVDANRRAKNFKGKIVRCNGVQAPLLNENFAFCTKTAIFMVAFSNKICYDKDGPG
jgi:hypothetical protein